MSQWVQDGAEHLHEVKNGVDHRGYGTVWEVFGCGVGFWGTYEKQHIYIIFIQLKTPEGIYTTSMT